MLTRDKIILSTVLAGSIGLAGIGVSRAQTTPVDGAVVPATVTATAETADEASPVAPEAGCQMKGRGNLDAMAEQFGMSAADLQTEINSGKPIYQIAAENGVTYETMKQKRTDEMKTRLDDMVKVGYMTQEQADEVINNMSNQPMMGIGFGHHGRWLK